MNNQYRNPVAALTNKKTELYIADLPAIFGRNDNSVDVYFFHESISREHCMFECINRRVTIRDLGSTVGTAVNGVKLEPNVPYNIEDGAKVTIGKVKFVFHADYEEIARRERMRSYENTPSQYADNGAGRVANEERYAPSSAPRAPKVITVNVRELTEYEYGEDEVVFIECGLRPAEKPVSFTSRIKKTDIEAALNEESEKSTEPSEKEDAKKTQVLSKEEIEKSARGISADKNETDGKEISEESTESGDTAEGKAVRLSWIDDETGKNKKIVIEQFPFSIGRKSDENDYALRKKGVSRKHMHFEETDGEYYIVDDNSTNGVRLNGNKITADNRIKIKSGDKISIADVTFSIRID